MSRPKKFITLITGSAGILGKLTAKTLANAGHHAFASMSEPQGRNSDVANELNEWAKKHDAPLDVIELDVTDTDSVNNAVQSIIDSVGRIDVLVNNAGIAAGGLLETFTLDQIQELFDVNTFGPLRVDRAVLPHMRKQGSGLLIHITGTVARVLMPFMTSYCASKAAVEALAEGYQYELASFGIESAIIEPGPYPMAILEMTQYPADRERASEYGRVAKIPEEIFASLDEMLSGPHGPNPQDVADAVKKLIEAKPGERPLRTVIDTFGGKGVIALNKATEKAQKEFLAPMGM